MLKTEATKSGTANTKKTAAPAAEGETTFHSGDVVQKSGIYNVTGKGKKPKKLICIRGESFYGGGKSASPLQFELNEPVSHQREVEGLSPVPWK